MSTSAFDAHTEQTEELIDARDLHDDVREGLYADPDDEPRTKSLSNTAVMAYLAK